MTTPSRPGRKPTLRAVATSLDAAECWQLRLGDLSNQERSLVGMASVARS